MSASPQLTGLAISLRNNQSGHRRLNATEDKVNPLSWRDSDSDWDDEDMYNVHEVLEARQPAEIEEAQLNLDDESITVEDACNEAASFVKHPKTITIDGKQVNKSTALRLFTGLDVDLEDWHLKAIFLVRNPYAVLVSCGDQLLLEVAQVTGSLMKLVYAMAPHKVPNQTLDALPYTDAIADESPPTLNC
eukprot:Em0013g1012a